MVVVTWQQYLVGRRARILVHCKVKEPASLLDLPGVALTRMRLRCHLN